MYKYRLMAPGPTPVPEDVMLEMAKPILHHRTAAVSQIVSEVQQKLKWLYQTQNDVVVLSSSGSGAMESCLCNVASQGDKILVVNGGKFGERFQKISKAFGLAVDEIQVEWGKAVGISEITEKLKTNTYKAVCVQASETSTGTSHPIKDIADLVKNYDQTVLIVDAITALGVVNLPTDEWQIDMMVCGSQKALMLPPGLSTVSVSEKAWQFIEQSDISKFYFDLKAERKALKKNTSAWTTPVTLLIGLNRALDMMQKEGLQNMFVRHQKMATAIQNAAKAIGLELFSSSPSHSVTSICMPQDLSSNDLVKNMMSNFNMTIANGQDDYKGKIFRIGHLGYFDMLDMISVWCAIEKTLSDLGYKFELGKGVAEIQKLM